MINKRRWRCTMVRNSLKMVPQKYTLSEWAKLSGWAKPAVQSKRTNEWSMRVSEWTSEWPSTYVPILGISNPLCRGWLRPQGGTDGRMYIRTYGHTDSPCVPQDFIPLWVSSPRRERQRKIKGHQKKSPKNEEKNARKNEDDFTKDRSVSFWKFFHHILIFLADIAFMISNFHIFDNNCFSWKPAHHEDIS